MTRTRLIVFFCCAGLLFLGLRLPLAAVIDGALPKGARASGTVWDGVIDGLNVPASPGARLYVQGSPWSLFTLGADAHWRMESLTIKGEGDARVSFTGGRRVTNALLTLDVSALPLPIPSVGTLSLTLSSLTLDHRGRCLDASGTVSTDSLQRTGRSLGWEGPVLEGPLECVAGHLSANLSGAKDGTDVFAQLSGDPATPLMLTVKNSPPGLAFALESAGFKNTDDGLVWLRPGRS